MLNLVVRTQFVMFLVTAIGASALAQDEYRDRPGKFDFYVLSLSWSPSYCAEAAERGNRDGGPECGQRPFAFVVHGLWPQYEHGFPEYCQSPSPRLAHNIVAEMLDLMPAPRLIYNEWDKHGTCSGLSPRAYFETIRKAREKLKVPPEYLSLEETVTVTPVAVEQAFIEANKGLSRRGIAVECKSRRLGEVRVCLSRDLQFRECPELVRHSCQRDHLVMPLVRGAN